MDLEKNKENAIAFYLTAYEGDPGKAVERDLYVLIIHLSKNEELHEILLCNTLSYSDVCM